MIDEAFLENLRVRMAALFFLAPKYDLHKLDDLICCVLNSNYTFLILQKDIIYLLDECDLNFFNKLTKKTIMRNFLENNKTHMLNLPTEKIIDLLDRCDLMLEDPLDGSTPLMIVLEKNAANGLNIPPEKLVTLLSEVSDSDLGRQTKYGESLILFLLKNNKKQELNLPKEKIVEFIEHALRGDPVQSERIVSYLILNNKSSDLGVDSDLIFKFINNFCNNGINEVFEYILRHNSSLDINFDSKKIRELFEKVEVTPSNVRFLFDNNGVEFTLDDEDLKLIIERIEVEGVKSEKAGVNILHHKEALDLIKKYKDFFDLKGKIKNDHRVRANKI